MRKSIVVAMSLFVVACSSDPDDADNVAGPLCAGTTNLLKNPGLSSSEERMKADWTSTQHGSRPSFDVSLDSGVLTIERTGPEPWYNLEQFVDLSEYIGNTMIYTADLKLSLDSEDWPHAFEPKGGLQVLIWARGELPVMGSRLAVNSSAEHSPNLGTTDWFRAHVEFTVPQRPDRAMFGLIHQANGSISFRNPELLDCGPAPEPAPQA